MLKGLGIKGSQAQRPLPRDTAMDTKLMTWFSVMSRFCIPVKNCTPRELTTEKEKDQNYFLGRIFLLEPR